jgi:hypothetical protein
MPPWRATLPLHPPHGATNAYGVQHSGESFTGPGASPTVTTRVADAAVDLLAAQRTLGLAAAS